MSEKSVLFEGTTEDVIELVRKRINTINDTLCDYHPELSAFISSICDMERQKALDELPNINFHLRNNAERSSERAEISSLKAQLKAYEENMDSMREAYWTLSRRLKLFANDFCLDESYAGAIRFIVAESNSEWMNRGRSYPIPSDSEIPF